MSDLSRMLDELYALPEEGDVVTDDTPTRAPAWASAEALDEAFASWVPGSSDGASALERAMVESEPDEPAVADEAIEQWLVESEPATEPALAGVQPWSPSDDDILPSRRRGRRRR